MTMSTLCFWVVLSLIFVASNATICYVSPLGSGPTCGTNVTPCKSLADCFTSTATTLNIYFMDAFHTELDNSLTLTAFTNYFSATITMQPDPATTYTGIPTPVRINTLLQLDCPAATTISISNLNFVGSPGDIPSFQIGNSTTYQLQLTMENVTFQNFPNAKAVGQSLFAFKGYSLTMTNLEVRNVDTSANTDPVMLISTWTNLNITNVIIDNSTTTSTFFYINVNSSPTLTNFSANAINGPLIDIATSNVAAVMSLGQVTVTSSTLPTSASVLSINGMTANMGNLHFTNVTTGSFIGIDSTVPNALLGDSTFSVGTCAYSCIGSLSTTFTVYGNTFEHLTTADATLKHTPQAIGSYMNLTANTFQTITDGGGNGYPCARLTMSNTAAAVHVVSNNFIECKSSNGSFGGLAVENANTNCLLDISSNTFQANEAADAAAFGITFTSVEQTTTYNTTRIIASNTITHNGGNNSCVQLRFAGGITFQDNYIGENTCANDYWLLSSAPVTILNDYFYSPAVPGTVSGAYIHYQIDRTTFTPNNMSTFTNVVIGAQPNDLKASFKYTSTNAGNGIIGPLTFDNVTLVPTATLQFLQTKSTTSDVHFVNPAMAPIVDITNNYFEGYLNFFVQNPNANDISFDVDFNLLLTLPNNPTLTCGVYGPLLVNATTGSVPVICSDGLPVDADKCNLATQRFNLPCRCDEEMSVAGWCPSYCINIPQPGCYCPFDDTPATDFTCPSGYSLLTRFTSANAVPIPAGAYNVTGDAVMYPFTLFDVDFGGYLQIYGHVALDGFVRLNITGQTLPFTAVLVNYDSHDGVFQGLETVGLSPSCAIPTYGDKNITIQVNPVACQTVVQNGSYKQGGIVRIPGNFQIPKDGQIVVSSNTTLQIVGKASFAGTLELDISPTKRRQSDLSVTPFTYQESEGTFDSIKVTDSSNPDANQCGEPTYGTTALVVNIKTCSPAASSFPVGAVVGGVVGGVILILAIVLIVICVVNRKKQSRIDDRLTTNKDKPAMVATSNTMAYSAPRALLVSSESGDSSHSSDDDSSEESSSEDTE